MNNIFLVAGLILLPNFLLAQNVGIGTATPQTQLHIDNATTNSIIRAETNKVSGEASLELKTGPDPFDFLEIRKWMTGSSGTQAGISLNGLSTLTTGTNSTAGLLFGTKREYPIYFTTDNVERMRINELGNVRIGNVFEGNTRLLVSATSGAAISAQTSFVPPPGVFISSISGRISTNSIAGAAISGITENAVFTTAGIPSGMYGVLGGAIDEGYAVGAFGSSGAGGLYAKALGAGKALRTQGSIQFEGLGAGLGKILTSDAAGNASWTEPATSHNHFGQTWLGSNSFAGLTISNSSAANSSTGLTSSASALRSIGVYGASTGLEGTGVMGFIDHGGSFPPYDANSAVAGVNTTGNGLYGTSYTGYAIKGIKQNSPSAVTGPVALLRNDKTTNTDPVLLIQNGATNPTALELNNGYIKVSGTNKTAFIHTTSAGNISGNLSVLNYPNTAATDMLFVTHNYSPVNTYFNFNYGVYWNGGVWSIYIEAPATPMPVNINFNVMVIKQ